MLSSNFLSKDTGRYSLLPTSSTDQLLSSMASHSAKIRSTSPTPTQKIATDLNNIEILFIPRRESLVPLLGRMGKRRPLLLAYSVIGGIILILVSITLLTIHYLPGKTTAPYSGFDPSIFADHPSVLTYSPNATFVAPESSGSQILSLQGTLTIDTDVTHILIPSQDELPLPPPLLQPISSRLPHPLLAYFYTYGHLPPKTDPETAPKPSPIDLVYLWVNASSPFFQAELDRKAGQEAIDAKRGKKKHWRDNGELRGAVRSGALALGESVGTVHVISGDYEFQSEVREEWTPVKGWRIGQIPYWLDWDSQTRWMKPTGERGLRWHFHSSLFRLPRDEDGSLPATLIGSTWEDEKIWRDAALPTFNSFGIETRVGFVEGLADEFVMSNDDMFMMHSLSSTDFHNPLYGPVIRLDSSPSLAVRPYITPDLLSTPGEWGGLQHASQLLSGRFPARSRMYMHHLPKALTRSLIQEASVMFASELTTAATRGFRESRRGEGDLEMAWLVSHLRIERWREALLWTWVVARVGVDGVWGRQAREEISRILEIDQLGPEGMKVDAVVIRKRQRKTLDDLKGVMGQAGWEMPKSTEYVFSSMDGHLPLQPEIPMTSMSCTFTFSQCLPPNFFNNPDTLHESSEIFKTLAFAQPHCGDCLIDALINASGDRGLHAVLPKREQVFFPSTEKRQWERSEPMLPLTSTWGDANFNLDAVVRLGQDLWAGSEIIDDGAVRLRDWCIKLLSRYAYTFATTPSKFSMIHTYFQLSNALTALDKSPDIALVCINDDQPDMPSLGTEEKFSTWMQGKWGGPSDWVDWEKVGSGWGY